MMAPYVEGRNLFIDWCTNIQSAVPIEFGDIGCPGLSDIDIGIVFKEGFDPDKYDLNQDLVGFPEKTKTLMNGGTLMFFPEAVFKHILLIDDIRVKSLLGEIDVRRNTSMESQLVSLVQIVEWLPERIAKIYSELKSESINEKRLVGSFYSLCYSLKKIQEHVGENERFNKFIKQVYSLREGWFSLDGSVVNAMLKDISDSYMDIFVEAVNSIMPVLNSHFNIVEPESLSLRYNIYKNVNFVANQKDIGILDTGSDIYINMPAAFLCTYVEYSKHNSQLGSIITRRIEKENANITVSGGMSDILDRRAHILGSLFDFVRTLNCGTGLYKFGWYLNE